MKRLSTFMAMCLSFTASLQAQELVIDENNYETYLEMREDEKKGNFCMKEEAEDLRSVKKLTFAASLPEKYRGFHYNDNATYTSTLLANLEEVVVEEGHYMTAVIIWGSNIKKLTINNGNGKRKFSQLNIQSARLSQDSIILGSDIRLTIFVLHRNKLTSLEPLYAMMDENMTSFLFNAGKYYRMRYAGVDDGTYNPTNQIREIDMSRIPAAQLKSFQASWNLLEKLENFNHPNVNNLMLRNNLFWSLDLSSITVPPGDKNYLISPQKPLADLTVVKGAAVDGSQDEIRLYLPEGQSVLFDNERLVSGSVKLNGTAVADQTIMGTETEKYFKVGSVAGGIKADLNMYAKHNGFSYKYNTRPAMTDEEAAFPSGVVDDSLGYNKRDLTLEIKTYPYIMYVHPATKSGVDYYSGTLWLDYDAIVPEGTTAWIVTGIDKKAVTTTGTTPVGDQLVLEKIGEPGNLIPAGTAMFVRSDSQAGLYAFHKAWTHEILGWDGTHETSATQDTVLYEKIYTPEQLAELAAQKKKIGDRNLLEGYATDTEFANKREALILGLESQKGTGIIGFWPFNGTVVPAHRAFISEATYRRVTGDTNAKGATFFFNDIETTGIILIQNGDAVAKDNAWYTLDGRRLTVKPTQKGMYIHKGRKELIR